MKKIAIIGSGLSGLTLAKWLKTYFEVTVFEKARGAGGRLATRREENFQFDHGAQYFTARTDAFKRFLEPFLDNGVVQQWAPKHVQINGTEIEHENHWACEEPRYVGVPGMNSVAKQLAQNIQIEVNTKITSLLRHDKWQLTDEDGKIYEDYDWVISTLPAPQAIELLPPEFDSYQQIKNIEMSGCFSLMLGFDKALPMKFEAAHISNSDLSWLAVNSHKPGRQTLFTLMIHSSEAYAADNMDANRELVMQHLIQKTSEIIGYDANEAVHKTIHGWRYANNVVRTSHPAFIDRDMNLGACGDWCVGGRVEGAFTSAFNLFNALKMNTA